MSENTTTAARTPQDFAIEFAEYMAKGAEALITAINADAEVSLRIAESDDVSDDDQHDAEATVSEMQRALRSDIYEFRKRRDRAASAPSPAPVAALPDIKDMRNGPQQLNPNDRAFWVLGWNECRDAVRDAARAAKGGAA